MEWLRDLLVDSLEAAVLLDGRYTKIECVNYDGENKRGFFSLVFKCNDTIEKEIVALKFLDPSRILDAYRIRAFEREPKILENLIGVNRCLQLKRPLQIFELPITPENSSEPRNFEFKYFVVAWIPYAVDEFFEAQQDFHASEKLLLFNDIVLAVEALHRRQIAHRDLKPDNLRAYQDNHNRVVVVIDVGTAAEYEVAPTAEYQGPVGALQYSPPEAFCGLAGCREIAQYSDYYSLGCLLFELFNKDYFMFKQRSHQGYEHALAAMAMSLSSVNSIPDKLNMWNSTVGHFKRMAQIPSIASDGNSVPGAIKPELGRLFRRLVSFDFNDRPENLEWVRRRTWSMIRVLEHQTLQQLRLEKKKQEKLLRAKKSRQMEERLRRYLEKKKISLLC